MSERVSEMYVKKDTLSTRIGLHEKYSVNPYGWVNWVFDQYTFHDGMQILELGCGTGNIWRGRNARLPKETRIVLTDFSPLMVEKAKDLLGNQPMFSFHQADIQDIPYPDESFDGVIANHMLYHVPDKDRALSEIFRVLKPDGRFYASTLGEKSLDELQQIYRQLEGKAHFTYSSDVSFTLENGFELLEKFFSHVEQRRYIDALEVTDIDDLLGYIQSYNDIPESVSGELHALIKCGFSPEGVFHIRKDQGLFICKK